MEKLNVQIHKEMKRKEEKKQKIVPDSEGECSTLCILGNFVCFLLSLIILGGLSHRLNGSFCEHILLNKILARIDKEIFLC